MKRDLIELVICVGILAGLAFVFFGPAALPLGPAEPKFLHYDPAGADDEHGRLEDCVSRLTAKSKSVVMQNDQMGPPDKPNICHESTHFLNSQIRCSNDPEHPKDNAVYIDHGRYLLFEEPHVTLTQVVEYLDKDTLAGLDDVMHTRKQWDKEPCYIFDEWAAYINGTTCCIEVDAPAPRLALSRLNMVRASKIAEAFIKCIEDNDPTYAQLDDMKVFVAWQKNRQNQVRGEQCSK